MNEGFRSKVDKEPTPDDGSIFSNEELDLDLSSDETIGGSLDRAAKQAEQAEVDKSALQAVQERLGIEHFASMVPNSADAEGNIFQPGQTGSNVYELIPKAKEEKSNPLTAESYSHEDLEAVRAAREQKAKETAELEAFRESLKKAA